MLLVLPAGPVQLGRAVSVYGSRWYCPLVIIIVLLVLLIFFASPVELRRTMGVDRSWWYGPLVGAIVLLVLLILLPCSVELGSAVSIDGCRWYGPAKVLIISSARGPRLEGAKTKSTGKCAPKCHGGEDGFCDMHIAEISGR